MFIGIKNSTWIDMSQSNGNKKGPLLTTNIFVIMYTNIWCVYNMSLKGHTCFHYTFSPLCVCV